MGSVHDGNARDRLDRLLGTITHQGNRATVRRYVQERLANGIHPGTLANDLVGIRDFSEALGRKRLEKATRNDVAGFVADMRVQRTWRNKRADGTFTVSQRAVNLSPGTAAERRKTLKSFFKWLRASDDYPPEVKWLKTTRPQKGSLRTDSVISAQEVKALLQAHSGAEDQALLASWFEAGLRAGEVCALRVGGVSFDEYGAVFTLPSGGNVKGLKTGARRIRLIDAAPYVHAWYEAHPRKADHGAPFFPDHRDAAKPLSPAALWQWCQRAQKKAGLKRHLHPHMWRHTAATRAARAGWTEQMMRAFFGWSRVSDEPSTYTHLAGLDYEEMLLEKRGLKARGEDAQPALAPLKCGGCAAPNVVTAWFCMRCRVPLTPEARRVQLERDGGRERDLAAQVTAQVLQSLPREALRLAVREEFNRVVAESGVTGNPRSEFYERPGRFTAADRYTQLKDPQEAEFLRRALLVATGAAPEGTPLNDGLGPWPPAKKAKAEA